VPESFDSVNRHHGNVVLIFSEQFAIRFNVDLVESKAIVTTGGVNRVLSFVAEVAAGS
jgi:hypothetical protein